MHYFDFTATTPVSENALNEYVRISKAFIGNPSSIHPLGIQAKEQLEIYRKKAAEILKIKPSDLFFTSGGTESNNIIIQSLLSNLSSGEVIFAGIEHSAVLENRRILEAKGWKVTVLKCPSGYLSKETLKEALNPNVRLVAVMAVNNVTGTVQDLKGLVSTVREAQQKFGRKIHFHCDAVQALGKIPFSPAELNVDSASFSAHKFYGPRGVGMLFNSNKSVLPLSKGGGQEYGMRAGTENLPAIAAMITALEESINSLDGSFQKVSAYRKIIEAVASECGFKLLSPSSESGLAFSPYILNISVKPLPSEVFLRIMSDKGFCLSAGSACSANTRGKAESVLSAMNVDSLDRMSSIRISFGSVTTSDEVNELADALKQMSEDGFYGK